MNNDRMNIRGWFARGFEAFKKNWESLVGFTAITLSLLIPILLIVSISTNLLSVFLYNSLADSLFLYVTPCDSFSHISIMLLIHLLVSTIPTQFLGSLIKPFIVGGIISGALMTVRGTPLSFSAHFVSGFKNYFRLLIFFLFTLLFVIAFESSILLFGPSCLLFMRLILFLAILLALLLFSCLTFVPFLLIDRRGGLFTCIGLSFGAFYRNYIRNTAMMLLTFFLCISGVLACLIGLFVTIPLAYTIWAVMYQDIYKEA